MTPEQKIKQSYNQMVRRETSLLTWPYFAGIYGTKFVPDHVGLAAGGRFVGIEFKAGRNQLSEGQARMRDRIESLGGAYFEVRTLLDIQEVIEWSRAR